MTNLEAYENLLEAAILIRKVEKEKGVSTDLADRILGYMVLIHVKYTDLPQSYEDELKEKIACLRDSCNSLIDLETIMIDKMEEMKKKRES